MVFTSAQTTESVSVTGHAQSMTVCSTGWTRDSSAVMFTVLCPVDSALLYCHNELVLRLTCTLKAGYWDNEGPIAASLLVLRHLCVAHVKMSECPFVCRVCDTQEG